MKLTNVKSGGHYKHTPINGTLPTKLTDITELTFAHTWVINDREGKPRAIEFGDCQTIGLYEGKIKIRREKHNEMTPYHLQYVSYEVEIPDACVQV